jgi:hypothetical protein
VRRRALSGAVSELGLRRRRLPQARQRRSADQHTPAPAASAEARADDFALLELACAGGAIHARRIARLWRWLHQALDDGD